MNIVFLDITMEWRDADKDNNNKRHVKKRNKERSVNRHGRGSS